MPNRLIGETSPYLAQHANNPVDWYPWSEEALQDAKRVDKPILLSIGYSACHWCHVMERESFENPATAQLMNANFINIKVDREERPDLDAIYMKAVQAMTGHGGWPMTMFLTPDTKPFYGGTYFPPEDRGGMPGFPRVLMTLSEIYRTRPADVVKATSQIMSVLQTSTKTSTSPNVLNSEILDEAYLNLADAFDQEDGGIGMAPKFPQPMLYDFLLHYHSSLENDNALQMVEFSLDKMSRGGIYDQLGGGFHRYSTDNSWLVPHFEKMLYDNALMARLYLHTYQATGHHSFRQVSEETLDYVLREMTSEEGGFYSSQDADSEGEEGKFFVWDPQEIANVLGNENASIFNAYYNVTTMGNFEGKNILHVPDTASKLASQLGVTPRHLEEVIADSRTALFQVRALREAPALDDKILTSWNGLMLQSLAEAAAVFKRKDYEKAAIANATFATNNLKPNGRVLRTYKDGHAKIQGYLEDYSFLIAGLLSLYELTFDDHWLEEALTLTDGMNQLFWTESEGVFYDTGIDHEALLIRPRELFDNAIPCGSSVAVEVLLKLSVLTDKKEYRTRAMRALDSAALIFPQAPSGVGRWLTALDFYLHQPIEIAITGARSDPSTDKLMDSIYARYLPNRVIAGMAEEDALGSHPIPLLRHRTQIGTKPTAYVCKNYICTLPTTDPQTLASQLDLRESKQY